MSNRVKFYEDDDSQSETENENNETNASQSRSAGDKNKTSTGVTIPKSHTSRVDSKGVKTVTTYRADPSNPNQILKTVTKIKVYVDDVRESKDVEKRRQWKKFGTAATSLDESNVTIQSRDDVYIEDPNADVDKSDEDAGKALAGNLNAFWLKQQRRQLERKYDVGDPDDADAGKEKDDAGDGWTKVGDTGRSGSGLGKYVPPSARGSSGFGGKSLAAMAESGGGGGGGGRGGGGGDRDIHTIRVTNISEDTTEADLQDLFQRFGRISRVYLAKDKETLQSRGFAFVSFVHRDDAARAMEKLQGYGYDHLILKLEWAKPSTRNTDPGSEGTQFRSGYGKALAQDTKEKVSFASNLTQGTR